MGAGLFEMSLVSIGIPVFNGENFIEDAIRSVLAQTLSDLELVISDNSSTDRTESICRDMAGSDPQIRYFRNERNLGAAPNYNRAWQESRGRYFKWLAHDDRIAPQYVEATVRELEARPEVMLCNTVVDYIDASGQVLATYDSELVKGDRERPSDRFAAMVLRSHSCVDFFGMTRRAAMVGSLLHGRFHGADRAFLAQMALRGRLAQLPQHLVEMREHSNRYTRQQQSLQARRSWHDSSQRGSFNFPTLTLYREYLKMLAHEPLSTEELWRCRWILSKWWLVNYNLARVGVDFGSVVFPNLANAAERVKNRVFGLAPGHFKVP